jgi:hypothetical protein
MNVVYVSLVAVALTAVLASGAPNWQPVTAVAENDTSYYTRCGAANCTFYNFAASTACLGAHTEYAYPTGACEHAVWKGVADSWRGGRNATFMWFRNYASATCSSQKSVVYHALDRCISAVHAR